MADHTLADHSLEVLLAGAPQSMAEESILLTGVILQAESPDQFRLQHRASSRSVYSVFRKIDVVGPVIKVSQSDLPLSELGSTIHAVRIRKGATGILFSEATHRVGDPPHEPAILKTYASPGAVPPEVTESAGLEEILATAPAKPGIPFSVFPGVIHPGTDETEIILQVDPPRRLDYAIIKRADIVDPGSIQELPQSSLPLSKRGFRIHLVRVREGATMRVIHGMQARVERQPQGECGCSGSPTTDVPQDMRSASPQSDCDHEHAKLHGPHHVIGGGRRCVSVRCHDGICCGNEWDPCDYQWAVGTCTTYDSWLWGKQTCGCLAAWAPL